MVAGDNDKASTMRVGSGTTVTAPMPTKWVRRMVSANRTVAAAEAIHPFCCSAATVAAEPNATPSTTEATTNSGDQTIWPGNSRAAIPM
jgi:hypothetical protein